MYATFKFLVPARVMLVALTLGLAMCDLLLLRWDLRQAGRPITTQIHQSSALSLFEGLHLLQALPWAWLVVSGGSRDPVRPPSALAYAQAARDMGVPAERIHGAEERH